MDHPQTLDSLICGSKQDTPFDEQLGKLKAVLNEVRGEVWSTGSLIGDEGWEVLSTQPFNRGVYNNKQTKIILLDCTTLDQDAAVHDSVLDDPGLVDQVAEQFLSQSSSSRSTSVNFKLAISPGHSLKSDQVWLSGQQLAQVGVTSTESVILRTANSSRICTALYRPPDNSGPDPDHVVFASATLVGNLFRNLADRAVTLTRTSLGPSDLPIADSLTLARVGSPTLPGQHGQLVEQLRLYFNQSIRQIAVGDLIPLSSSALSSSDGVRLPGAIDVSPEHEPVYFRVTDVESGSTSSSTWSSTFAVDPTVTRIVQSGVDHDYGFISDDRLSLSSFGASGLELSSYVRSALRSGAPEYGLELSVLLSGRSGVGKKTLARRVAHLSGLHFVQLDLYDLLGESDVKSAARLSARLDQAKLSSPCLILLGNQEAIGKKSQQAESSQERKMVSIIRQAMADSVGSRWPIIFVGTTGDHDSLSVPVRSLYNHQIGIDPPSQEHRLEILQELSQSASVAADVDFTQLALQTAALVPADLVQLVSRARQAATNRVLSAQHPDLDSISQAGLSISWDDFESALRSARESYSISIGAPKIPSVSWDQVGGLANVKDEILETIQLPLLEPELFQSGLKKRSGILLYGPPGTGKTLLAKAVATTCSLNFFSVKGPELLDMYIGESEANVRRVFQRAREAKPCVIFFDELDSVAPKRGNQGDSGGVMDRIVSQLLAELDGMGDQAGDVFVIGATNRPDLLDPALLRPGRFDRMLYLGVSQTHADQLKILLALTRQFKLDKTTDLGAIADECPFNYTGADLYALCSDAMLKAMTRQAHEIDAKLKRINDSSNSHPITAQYYLAELATEEETEVVVNHTDFQAALAEVTRTKCCYSSPPREHSSTLSSLCSWCRACRRLRWTTTKSVVSRSHRAAPTRKT